MSSKFSRAAKSACFAMSAVLLTAALTSCSSDSSSEDTAGQDTETSTSSTDSTTTSTSEDFSLTSPAIVDGELLSEFQCEEKIDSIEASIPLAWSGVPSDAASLAVIMHHYPFPDDTTEVNGYLMLWGIDPSVTEIAHGAADDGPWFLGSNKDGNVISYTSPCSPSEGSHEYTLTLYALETNPVAGGLLPGESSLEVNYEALLSAVNLAGIVEQTALVFNSTTTATAEATTLRP